MNTLYKITYEVVVTCEDGVSLNNATDAVSLALWQLGQDGELVETTFARLIDAEELPSRIGDTK